MRRVLHLGLACALGAAALGVDTQARAADGGGWPTIEAGVDGASADSGAEASADAGPGDAGAPSCPYGDAGYGDGGTPPVTMSPEAILAYYCGDAEMQCVTSPIAFDHTVELADWLPDWDTGWIPKNFDELQVRFILQIPADTQVKLSGKLQTTWPDALTLVTPGDRNTGFLRFDYGLVVHAWGKIDVSLLGYHIKWQGDLPYLPQVDFHLLGMESFDSWAFDPNSVSASAFSPKIQLFHINILGLVGVPSEVAEGGVDLAIAGELKTTYVTNKIVITPSVVPITTENGSTIDNFLGGSFAEYDVHPEGTVTYDGIIHLIPEFYVEVLGKEFNMPIYDYPISLSDIVGQTFTQDFIFDKIKVHVPLPDVPRLEKKVWDFGKVPVGSGEKFSIPIPNWGEGRARAWGEVQDSMKTTFDIMTPSLLIDPCTSEELKIRFKPKKAGDFKATLTLYSNDPDTPSQEIELRGEAVGEDFEDPDGGGSGGEGPGGSDGNGLGAVPLSGDAGGCGCRMEPSDTGTLGVLMGLGFVALAGSRRRRRAGRTCD